MSARCVCGSELVVCACRECVDEIWEWREICCSSCGAYPAVSFEQRRAVYFGVVRGFNEPVDNSVDNFV